MKKALNALAFGILMGLLVFTILGSYILIFKMLGLVVGGLILISSAVAVIVGLKIYASES